MARKQNAERQAQSDLKEVLALPAGRRYLFELMEYCGVMRDVWSPNAEIHRKAGMQAVGFKINGDIQAVAPELVSWKLTAGMNVQEDEEENSDV